MRTISTERWSGRGCHYLLSMRTWAAGLNAYLLAHPEVELEPFSEW